MKRSELRETIFKLLFIAQFNDGEEMPEQVKNYLESLGEGREELEYGYGLSGEDEAYIRAKYEQVTEKIPEIDELLNKTSKGWKTSRMSKVDLTILRLAVYEVLYDDDVPAGVAIDQAVEIAKCFSGQDSASFINGILGKIYREAEQKD